MKKISKTQMRIESKEVTLGAKVGSLPGFGGEVSGEAVHGDRSCRGRESLGKLE